MSDEIDPSKQLVPHYLAVRFTESARFLGVETKLFQLNVAVGFFMILMLKMFWWAFLLPIFHFLLKWVTETEPKIREIYIKYQSQGDHYEPWGGIPSQNNKRPIGFGRDESC